MDGADDLAAINALQVDAGDPKVGVPKLTLDHHERNALVRHLDRAGGTSSGRPRRTASSPASRQWLVRISVVNLPATVMNSARRGARWTGGRPEPTRLMITRR
jgi:hypothetical protein